MKKVQIFSLLFLLAFAVAACTPQQQQEVSDTMMEDDAMVDDDSMMKEDDSVMEDDSMMEDEKIEDDSMMKDDSAMMEDNSMMEEAATFNVGGTNFAYDVKEIRVKQGQKVKINFTSNGGFHDWVVDEFNAATSKVQAGQSTSIEFVADKKGTFEYYCSVGSHRQQGMVGKLIVE